MQAVCNTYIWSYIAPGVILCDVVFHVYIILKVTLVNYPVHSMARYISTL